MIDHSRRFSVLLSLLAVCVPNVTAAEAPRVLIADWEMEQIATEPNLVTPVGCCHDEERLFYEGGSATMAVVATLHAQGGWRILKQRDRSDRPRRFEFSSDGETRVSASRRLTARLDSTTLG